MLSTTLCYIEKDGKILLLHRNKKKKDINHDKWIGVGGKFEPGETAEECLVREVFEETGLTLTAYEHVGVIKFYDNAGGDQDMYLFMGTDFTGEIKTDCPEGDLEWVDRDGVLSLPTWEGDHLFIEPMLAGRRNLNMTVRYENDVLVEFTDDTKPVEVHTSRLISSPHAFSTRIGGVSDGVYESLNLGMNRGDDINRVKENWRRFLHIAGIFEKEFVCGAQVHGNNVHIATHADARPAYGPGELIEADGYVTAERNLPLAIFTADCVPLLMEDPVAGVVGAIHCGWRSTVADIEGNAVKRFTELNSRPENIRAAIGPAIDVCCFEVGPEVIEAVQKLLDGKAGPFVARKDNGKFMLDLRAVVRARLIALGLKPENIERCGGCTMCNPSLYYSHRYSDGVRGSLAAVISKA